MLMHQNFGYQGPCIVFAGHDRAVGTRAAKGYQIVWGERRHQALPGEGIARFADRSYNVIGLVLCSRRGFDDGNDIVMGIIHGRTDEIVHRGVEDQEIAALARFYVDHLAHHYPGIASHETARLDLDLAAQMAQASP